MPFALGKEHPDYRFLSGVLRKLTLPLSTKSYSLLCECVCVCVVKEWPALPRDTYNRGLTWNVGLSRSVLDQTHVCGLSGFTKVSTTSANSRTRPKGAGYFLSTNSRTLFIRRLISDDGMKPSKCVRKTGEARAQLQWRSRRTWRGFLSQHTHEWITCTR